MDLSRKYYILAVLARACSEECANSALVRAPTARGVLAHPTPRHTVGGPQLEWLWDAGRGQAAAPAAPLPGGRLRGEGDQDHELQPAPAGTLLVGGVIQPLPQPPHSWSLAFQRI